jgi:hypothetical protein
MNTENVLDVAKLIPELNKEYDGDLLEVIEDELDKRNLTLKEFIVGIAKIVNDLIV